jgi:hypothetical protein
MAEENSIVEEHKCLLMLTFPYCVQIEPSMSLINPLKTKRICFI